MDIIYKDKIISSPTVRQYYTLKYPELYQSEDVMSVVEELTDSIETWNDLSEFIAEYILTIDGERMRNPELIVPYAPSDVKKQEYFNCNTADVKQVSDYTGLNFTEIYALDIFEFWGYLHDLVVWECSQTGKGREYLENAYINSQTKPDRKMLRKMFGRKEDI